MDKQPETINNVLRLNFLEFKYISENIWKKFVYLKKNKENDKRFNN